MDFIKSHISKIKDKFTKTDLERKLKEATSNEHCHASVSLLEEISSKTSNYADFQVIVAHCLKKLESKKEKWRKVLKTLFLIEQILRTGSPNFADSMKSDIYKLKNLSSFSFIESNKSDKGETIREKSKFIVGLLEDRQKLKEEREKYSKWRNRIEAVSSSGSIGSVSSSNYNSSNFYSASVSYLDKNDQKEKFKKKKDESDESSEEEDKKEKKERKSKKQVKKKESSSEDENEKKAEKIEEPKKKIVAATTSNISIKKPGGSSSNSTTQNNNLMFDPFENTKVTALNSNGNQNSSNINDIFGQNTSSASQNNSKGNNNSTSFPDVFSNLNLNTQNPTANNGSNFIDFQNSFNNQNTTNLNNNVGQGGMNQNIQSSSKVDTQKLLSDMYNSNSTTNFITPSPQISNYGGYQGYINPNPNANNLNMSGGYNNYSQGWNQNLQMNNINPSFNYNSFQQQSFNNSQPNFSQKLNQTTLNNTSQTNSISFATSWSQPTKTKNQNNDDDFREVEEEDTSKSNQKKGALSGLLDPKLVNLNDLKANKKPNHTPNYNFY